MRVLLSWIPTTNALPKEWLEDAIRVDIWGNNIKAILSVNFDMNDGQKYAHICAKPTDEYLLQAHAKMAAIGLHPVALQEPHRETLPAQNIDDIAPVLVHEPTTRIQFQEPAPDQSFDVRKSEPKYRDMGGVSFLVGQPQGIEVDGCGSGATVDSKPRCGMVYCGHLMSDHSGFGCMAEPNAQDQGLSFCSCLVEGNRI